MASITVRNLPGEVHRGLKQLAVQNNRSTEAEIRNTLATVVRQRTGGGLGTTLHKSWGNNLGDDLNTPRSVLAECLFSQSDGVLEFTAQPRSDLRDSSHPLSTLRDAEEHDRFLIDALSTAREMTIVSPWIIASTMKRAGLLDAFQSAVARGAEIDVFADPLLNQLKYDDGVTQLEAAKSALQDVGVRVHEVRQLHSKIVIVDANRLCIGSYNWLSADRKGRYARHETSIIYNGSHLQSEIDVIKQSLGAREKR